MSLTARTTLFGLYCLCVAGLSLPALSALVEYSRSDSSASHHVLVPFVTGALLYLDRGAIFSSVRAAWRPGLALVAVGLVGRAIASLHGGPDGGELGRTLSVAAILVLWTAGFVACYGTHAARTARFALLFLAFTVPVPAPVLDAIVQVLKAGSAEAVAGLFTLTGMPYHREAFVFALPTVTIEVADQCSGIRSSIALFLTSLLAGHLFLRQTWTAVLLAMAVLPVTILKNGIRIVTLSWLAIEVNPAFLVGRLHTDGGVVFFGLALTLLAPVLAVLRRVESGSVGGGSDTAFVTGHPLRGAEAAAPEEAR